MINSAAEEMNGVKMMMMVGVGVRIDGAYWGQI